MSTAIDFFPGGARQKIEKAVNEAIKKGKSYNLELPFITAKGNNLWVIAQGNPQMKNGKCIRLHGTFQDITKRKQAELELKKKTAILKRTEQIAHVGSWDWDIESDTVTWSDELYRVFKRNPKLGAVSYAEHPQIYTPESMKKLDEAVQKCVKKGKSYEIDLKIFRGDGKTAFCSASGFAKKDENGKVVQLYGSFQDITKRKEAEEKLKAINQQLIASEQQLMASNQQLAAMNQQLISGEQQLRAANQQLAANEQQLRAANQQLTANEEELKKSNETLKIYLDVAAEIVLSLDENGIITLLNESGHRILGYQPGELIGKNWFAICLPKEEQKNVEKFFLKLKNKNETGSFNFENQIFTKTGERKDILWHNSIFRDENGNFKGTLSTGEDITLRKRAEIEIKKARDEARRSERRFRKAQEVGHIGSWEFNLITNKFWGSDEAKRIYNLDLSNPGFSAEEVMKIVVEKDRDRVNQAMIDLVGANKPYDIVFEIIPKNTSDRKIIHSIAELQKDETGKPKKVIGVLHDVTVQKTIEKQLIEAKEEAEQADRLKSAFLANMSHEIRTPMNGIMGFTELLQNPELSGEQQQKFIEIIHKSGDRMLETVNAIIDISRIETGQTEIKLSTINVNNEIEALYNFFLPEARNKGLQLNIENFIPESDCHWDTDVSKFNSIFTNLVKNALKYSDEGFVNIGCEIRNKQLYCFVKDTGIGIPKERQAAIFNRFEQADIEDTRVFEGCGLGLAIAKAYTEMLGGEIGVESEEGKGSAFWFSLPKQAEQLKQNAGEDEAGFSENNISQKLKVIIAEDDGISAKFLSILLKNTAREILVATSGKETVELSQKHPDTDLILMDIKMPEGNGYDSLKEIRQFNKEVKIIAQTANALAGDREKALEAGFDEYVSKPVRKKDLISKIEKLLQ
ncbi:PAS domain S-box-containing protein [Tangfeifania diversioriginum]|uniref:histidine kinase n=1 Tax=Tangfeifania diversioriginum TaxID=1168035 RepID=A0A1M6NZH6_9BACT|nr:PAS domain-containing protein [Tangfeifania diversioriginum]SHK01127.1 PAS domain S-box-containing protein [Tangfeifania diversioriginum]